MENQIDFKQIVTGFQFNMAWFIEFTNSVIYLTDKPRIASSDEKEHQEKVKPLQVLLSDLVGLVKDQTTLGATLTQSESDTPVISLSGH